MPISIYLFWIFIFGVAVIGFLFGYFFNSLFRDIGRLENEPYFGWCDVDGCELDGCSGGNAWRETGYWTVCYQHADDFRNGKIQPTMKQKAIDRENSRDPTTGYLKAQTE